MRFVSIFVRITLIVGVFLTGSDAFAGPVRCSVNNQDSTCVGHLTTAWQTAPTCPAQPGWTTVASAQWIGSQYSAPQCSYQEPPSCPADYSTVSGASWNGSAWVGLTCAIPPPPTQGVCQYGFASGPVWNGSAWSYSCNSPPADPVSQCLATATPQGYTANSGVTGPSPMNAMTSLYAQVVGLTNYGSDSVYTWTALGPTWTTACGYPSNVYNMSCLVHPNGQINGVIPSHLTTSSGSCNH